MTGKNRPLILFIFLAFPIIFEPPEPARAADIAILKSQSLAPYDETISEFLKKTGLEAVEYNMEGDPEKGVRMGKELAAGRPKIIAAIGTKASLAASNATGDIPIVSLLVSRPEVYLAGKSNVTGISLNPDPKEQFRLLKTILPSAKKIGVIYGENNRSKEIIDGRAAARGKFELVEKVISSEAGIPAAVRAVMEEADALWLVMDDKVISEQSLRFIITASIEYRRPVFGFTKNMVKQGTLFSSFTKFNHVGQQGAEIAKRILDGEVPSDIPFAYPRPSGYVLNLRTARLLNLAIPEFVIKYAGEVYE